MHRVVVSERAATDMWQLARAGFTRLLGRGDREREAVAERRLDALAAEVEQSLSARRDEVPSGCCRLGGPAWRI